MLCNMVFLPPPRKIISRRENHFAATLHKKNKKKLILTFVFLIFLSVNLYAGSEQSVSLTVPFGNSNPGFRFDYVRYVDNKNSLGIGLGTEFLTALQIESTQISTIYKLAALPIYATVKFRIVKPLYIMLNAGYNVRTESVKNELIMGTTFYNLGIAFHLEPSLILSVNYSIYNFKIGADVIEQARINGAVGFRI